MQVQARMTMERGVAAGNQHLEGAAQQGQDTRIPAGADHRCHAMIVGRFIQRGMVRLQGLALQTGALHHGHAGLQQFACHPQYGFSRHTHQRGAHPVELSHMRNHRVALQAARQGSVCAGPAHDTCQPQFRIVDQGFGTGQTQTAQTDDCHL